METIFKDFEYTIKEGLKNLMPKESKLIILGQMHYAMERGDLTIKEVEKLEEILGIGLKNHRQALFICGIWLYRNRIIKYNFGAFP